jgi:hypothetical protein
MTEGRSEGVITYQLRPGQGGLMLVFAPVCDCAVHDLHDDDAMSPNVVVQRVFTRLYLLGLIEQQMMPFHLHGPRPTGVVPEEFKQLGAAATDSSVWWRE